MLTKLTYGQISTHWDIIKFGIENSLPPIVGEHSDRMNRILSALLCGKLQCWASYIRKEDVVKFEGIVVTKLLFDDASYTRSLLIYCLYGYGDVETISWLTGLETLKKFAKSKRCSRIIAYTNSPYIIKLVKKLNGKSEYVFLSFDLN